MKKIIFKKLYFIKKFFINDFNKFKQLIINFSLFLSVFYFFIRFIDLFILLPFPMGDEWAFFADYNFIKKHGFYNSIEKGISISFNIIHLIVNSLINNLKYSLRFSGFISTVLLILYFLIKLKNKDKHVKKIFFSVLLFLIVSTGATIHGTNDSLFFLSLIIFLIESVETKINFKRNKLLRLSSGIIMILTRKIFIIYIFSFFIANLIFSKLKNKYLRFKVNLSELIICFLVVVIINIPKILSDPYSLSYTDKSIKSQKGITWVEWVYFSQKVGNENRYGFFAPMVNANKVKEYKNNMGDGSLPDTFFEYLTFDLPFTLRRALSSIFEISIISLRYLGFLLVLFPIYLNLFKGGGDKSLILGYFSIINIFIWAIIWPGLIQHRWLYPSYICITFFLVQNYESLKSIFLRRIIIVNLLLIDLIILWSLYKEKFFYSI
jgi:hypothetical protein